MSHDTEESDGDRFDIRRKYQADRVAEQVSVCLQDYYDVSEKCVVDVEQVEPGIYDTEDSYKPHHLLDYAGIDWIVDDKPQMVGVAERIRPNEDRDRRPDFSLRFDNGTQMPCETDRIPANMTGGGLFPRECFFGRQTGNNLDKGWLIDMPGVIDAIDGDELDVTHWSSGDGTKAGYISISDLAMNGLVLEGWDDPDVFDLLDT